jgi:2-methylisocitrate lyase-like PEP mutase family enzyme
VSGAAKLRALLATSQPLLSMGIYDCFSARTAERAGFELLSISGNALTASLLGLPDLGLITMTEVALQARRIADCVDIPVLADGDTGYGNVLNVVRTVREFEAAGIAALSLEDQVFPKRSSTIGTPALVSAKEMSAKIRAACEARRSADFVVIGRTDSVSVEGVDAAIERCQRYAEAGADILFINALEREEDMRRVTAAIAKPVKINVVEGQPAAILGYPRLFELGFRMVNYSGVLQRAAGRAMVDAMDVLRAEGTSEGSIKSRLMTPKERYEIIGVEKYKALEARLNTPD